jgi:hypothetical protein
MAQNQDFLGGMARLNAIFERLGGKVEADRQQTADRGEVVCIRCEEWPCICGDPEFEAFVSEELRKAEEHD